VTQKSGPLSGVKVVEIAGIGPAPVCGMMLADMGADVILIDRKSTNPNAPSINAEGPYAFYNRGKRSVAMDLKQPEAISAVLDLVESSDILIEGFRPGVMERLGLGPDVCLEMNPALAYGRLTGWGQTGPLAQCAGHDLNFLALSGALYYSGHDGEAPFPPATVVGDVGGGSLPMAFGLVCALWHARATGQGQVVDAAIVDGASYMSILLSFTRASGMLPDGSRGQSFMTAGAPWYDSYECSDGKYITVGALEPNFYALLIKRCGFQDDPDLANQWDKSKWAAGKAKFAKLFKTKTRKHWSDLMEGTDICFGPVLNLVEAAEHPHNVARDNFVEIDGYVQPAPAPKFSKTKAEAGKVGQLGADTKDILSALGYSKGQLQKMKETGAI